MLPLRCVRTPAGRKVFSISEVIAFRNLAASSSTCAVTNNNADRVRPRAAEEPIESYVRTIREEWGRNLPGGLLSQQEREVYERYYGPPVRTLTAEEIEEELHQGEEALELEDGTVVLEDIDGAEIGHEVEELHPPEEPEPEDEGLQKLREGEIRVRAEKEATMYAGIGVDTERSRALVEGEKPGARAGGVDTIDEFEGNPTEEPFMRTHPLTQLGQFGTHPATVITPEHITKITAAFLSDFSNKHLDEAAYKILGGEALPHSPITTGKSDKHYNSMPLDTSHGMSDMESHVHLATILPGYYAQSLSALTELRRRLGGDWLLGSEDRTEPGVKQILDVGTGGAGILAWRSMIQAERALRNEAAAEREEVGSTETKPTNDADASAGFRPVVVVGSNPLRFRMSKLLENTTFIPRLPDALADTTPPVFKDELSAQETAPQKQPRKLYDLIISTNTILPIYEGHKRKAHIQNLWSLLNPNGGVLLLIEKGTPRGFEAIAGARQNLLNLKISTPDSEFMPITEADEISAPRIPKEIASIVAPCTNHKKCPMYIYGPGRSSRRDYCSFMQRYERPGYMQRVLKAKTKNHEDLQYSYVAVRRGVDVTKQESPPIDPRPGDLNPSVVPSKNHYSTARLRSHAYSLPRTVFPPIKRRGHIALDVCTAQGKIERWVVPKSHGKAAYRDARKAQWGDLWALGAKTKTARNLKLGEKKPTTPKKSVVDLACDGFSEVEKDKPGGKKKNPGKRARERRQAQREAQKSRQMERDMIR